VSVVLDRAVVDGFATKVLAEILVDVFDGVVPPGVGEFRDLHLFVDANMYLEDVGQVYDGSEYSIAEINAIEDEVTRRIRDGALVGWRELPTLVAV
jgi:hypothetical protein